MINGKKKMATKIVRDRAGMRLSGAKYNGPKKEAPGSKLLWRFCSMRSKRIVDIAVWFLF